MHYTTSDDMALHNLLRPMLLFLFAASASLQQLDSQVSAILWVLLLAIARTAGGVVCFLEIMVPAHSGADMQTYDAPSDVLVT